MWEHTGAIVTAFALLFNVLTALVALLLRHSMLQTKVELTAAISQSRNELYDRLERQSREFGEVATALRSKISEVELYTRDHFVRKEAFAPVMLKIEGDIRDIGDRIETRLLRMEQKIDSNNGA